MNYPKLSEIYEIVSWHKERDKNPGESVGIFITLPKEIAEQFPKQGRESEDTSPNHVTLCYVGNYSLNFEHKLLNVVKQICSQFKPFTVRLGKPDSFVNDKKQHIIHSPIKSKKLVKFHDAMKQALQLNQIPVDTKYGTFKPHSTIAYANDELEAKKYKGIKPTGEFDVEYVYVWGLTEPHMFMLGK